MENLADILVDSQVGIALAVAQLRLRQGGVRDNLPIHDFVFGGRQRGDGLCQQPEALHAQGDFTAAGAEHLPAGLQEVPQVELAVEQLKLLLAQVILPQE